MSIENLISIVIVTYNRPNYLKNLLDQVVIQSKRPNSIIIIENDLNLSAKPIYEYFRREHPNINFKYQVNRVNSLTRGRNLGIELVDTDIVCLLDDDISITQYYLEVMLQNLLTLPSAIGVQAAISFPPRNKIRNYFSLIFRHFHLTKSKCIVFTSLNGSYPTSNQLVDPLVCQWFSGTNQMYLTAILKIIKWDEKLIAYSDGEDIDHSFRVHKSGLGNIWLVPTEKIIHHAAEVSRKSGYSAIFMREAYSYYLSNKLFGTGIQTQIKYIWSRLGFAILEVNSSFSNKSKKSTPSPKFVFFKVVSEIYSLRTRIQMGDLEEVNKRINN
jgi:GT2 family glycosyltransferase